MEVLLLYALMGSSYLLIPAFILFKRHQTKKLGRMLEEFLLTLSPTPEHANERTLWYGQATNDDPSAWFYLYLRPRQKTIGRLHYVYGQAPCPIASFPPMAQTLGRCSDEFGLRLSYEHHTTLLTKTLNGAPDEVLKLLMGAGLQQILSDLLAAKNPVDWTLEITSQALHFSLDLQSVMGLQDQLEIAADTIQRIKDFYAIFKHRPSDGLNADDLSDALQDPVQALCHNDIQTELARISPQQLPAALQSSIERGDAPMHIRLGHAWSHPERYREDSALLNWLASKTLNPTHISAMLAVTTPSKRVYPPRHINALMLRISPEFCATTTYTVPMDLQLEAIAMLRAQYTASQLRALLLKALNTHESSNAILINRLATEVFFNDKNTLIDALLTYYRTGHANSFDTFDLLLTYVGPEHEELLLQLLDQQMFIVPILTYLARCGTGLTYSHICSPDYHSAISHPKQTQKTLRTIESRHKRSHQEHAGALSVSVDETEQQGALSLTQEAGGLQMLSNHDINEDP